MEVEVILILSTLLGLIVYTAWRVLLDTVTELYIEEDYILFKLIWKLVSCLTCLSFWIGLIAGKLTGFSLVESLLFAIVLVGVTTLLNKLNETYYEITRSN